jgi:hypothetical protein
MPQLFLHDPQILFPRVQPNGIRMPQSMSRFPLLVDAKFLKILFDDLLKEGGARDTPLFY